jgi:hypothetical protein
MMKSSQQSCLYSRVSFAAEPAAELAVQQAEQRTARCGFAAKKTLFTAGSTFQLPAENPFSRLHSQSQLHQWRRSCPACKTASSSPRKRKYFKNSRNTIELEYFYEMIRNASYAILLKVVERESSCTAGCGICR